MVLAAIVGADYGVIETYHSARALGAEALKAKGVHPFRAEQVKAAFHDVEMRGHTDMYAAWRKEP